MNISKTEKNGTEKIEHAKQMSKKKASVALSSVFASFFLTLTKLIVGLLTGSIGIISEAAHSGLDFLAALMTFFAVKEGDKPADSDHPFGHAKIESVSALVETGLLFLTSFWIIYEAIRRLIVKNVEIQVTWYAFAVVILSIIVDISRSRALSKTAKESRSQALEADALHFSSDIWSSLVVLIGLIFVSFGINGADSIAALGVALFVLLAGWRLGKRTFDVLIDTAPEGLTDIVKNTAEGVEGVISVDRIRVRPLGPAVFIDMEINVSRQLPLEKVQSIISDIERQVHKKIPEADIMVHSRPTQLDNETMVESLRLLAVRHNLSVHNIFIDTIDGKKHVSYDLEVSEDLTVRQAHESATLLESEINKNFGVELDFITTHIEPLSSQIITSSNISKADQLRCESVIKKIVKDEKGKLGKLYEPHNILIRKVGRELFMTLNCFVDEKLPIDEAHSASGKLEYLILQKLPEIKRVVVHVEPEERK